MCFLGSLGSKSQVGQPSSGVYGTSAAPVASQSSGSFAHSATATTTAPYSADTSTDYSQYNQAYTQVTHTLTLQRNLILNPPLTSHKKTSLVGFCLHLFLIFFCHVSQHIAADIVDICRPIQTQFQMFITLHSSKKRDLD